MSKKNLRDSICRQALHMDDAFRQVGMPAHNIMKAPLGGDDGMLFPHRQRQIETIVRRMITVGRQAGIDDLTGHAALSRSRSARMSSLLPTVERRRWRNAFTMHLDGAEAKAATSYRAAGA